MEKILKPRTFAYSESGKISVGGKAVEQEGAENPSGPSGIPSMPCTEMENFPKCRTFT
jgi:hypothetical protein